VRSSLSLHQQTAKEREEREGRRMQLQATRESATLSRYLLEASQRKDKTPRRKDENQESRV